MSIHLLDPSAAPLLFRPLEPALALPARVPEPPPPPPAPEPVPEKPEPHAPPHNPFGGVFRPGLPELGLTQHVVAEGDTVWRFLEAEQILPPRDGGNPDHLVNAYLAGTPTLDLRAFGQRPGNSADAVRLLQPGDKVVVLDATRLNYLEQQRRQLETLQQARVSTDSQATRREQLQQQLVATIYQELDYAGTQQAVPSPDALAAPVRARAPQDAVFQQAVDEAVSLYRANLEAQGRTGDAFGVLVQRAQAGDHEGVRQAVREQLLGASGDSRGPAALGKIVARGSVYMTYTGDDVRFAQAVQQGIDDAEHEVLVQRPVDEVLAAYDRQGAAGAMRRLAELTDPAHTTPGQVGQIMADERTQQLVARVLDDIAAWSDPRGGPGAVIADLVRACDHAQHSDGGKPGIGQAAVDRIAQRIVALYEGPSPRTGGDVFHYPFRLQNVLSNGDGQVALALAVAEQAGRRGHDALALSAVASADVSLQDLASGTRELNKRTQEDAAFLSVPAQEWGGAGTPAEQAACVRRLLAQNPQEAKKLAEGGQELLRQRERIEAARAAVQAYQGPEAGRIRKAMDEVPTPAMAPAEESGKATNTLWFQRSLRKVVELAGSAYISRLGKGDAPLLPPRGMQVMEEVWKRGHKTLGAVLYFQNAAFELAEFGRHTAKGSLVNGLTAGASALRQELAGVSYALSAGIPGHRLGAIRPGSGATPLARTYADYAARVDALSIPDSAKLTLKQGLRLALQDSSDFASAILGAVSAATAFHEGKHLQGVGQTFNALGYTLMLTGSGIDEAVFAADVTLLRMGATAWTGIGAALVLVGSMLYTGAEAYDNSHRFDGASQQWLQAMGVRPEVARPLAVHATSLDGNAPAAGPFLTAYFKHNGLSQKDMVSWLNLLSPKDADAMASAIKSFGDEWKEVPMPEASRRFSDALLQYGLMPPNVKLLAGG
ncbi:MAG: hypothetical protein AB1430_05435 [Pseudomonadota bacterium]